MTLAKNGSRFRLVAGLILGLTASVLAAPSETTASDGASSIPVSYHGTIGVGSWNTSVEYKDIVVTRGDEVLYRSDFANQGAHGWLVHSGIWSIHNGAYRQATVSAPGIATAGEADWSNYTLELKARKIAGEEGFLIFFNWLDDENFHCFNIGGWQNTESAIQQNVNGRVANAASVAQHIETNVWYDIRVVATGPRIECYVNSRKILTTSRSVPPESGRRGAVGVGSWNTSVDYRNILVTSNGVTLYRSNFETDGTNGWQFFNGDWSVSDGVLHQREHGIGCRAIIGDPGWANYTITLQARKTGGDEGFLVWFNWLDYNNVTWFNVGGWTNTLSGIEQNLNGTRMIIGDMVPLSVEPDVWYDIRVVVTGPQIACYVNSKFIQRAYASTIISTNAVFLDSSKNVNDYVLQFQIGHHKFNGLLPRVRGTPPELTEGSLVQLTGIRRMLKQSADANSESSPEFEVLLSSPDDVVLLQSPPWWTWKRLLWAGGIVLCALFLALAWIVMISQKNRLLNLAQLELKKANEELESRVEKRTADLAKANADLSHEQALFRALLDNSSDYIYFKDARSRFIRCSLSMCTRSGLPHDQLVGKSDGDIFDEEHARAAFENEQEIIRTGQPLIGKLETEMHPDGRITWVMTTKMPWRDADGKIIGTFGISRDITAIKETEARLEQVHQQLVDSSRMAGQAEVAASVLHNVGNVLNSVNVSTGIIQRRVRTSQTGASISRVAELLVSHQHDLPGFFSQDKRAGKLPPFLKALADQIASEQASVLTEISSLASNVEHIKEIVAMQQNYARVSGLVEFHSIASLVEDALMVNASALEALHTRVVRRFETVPEIAVDKHRALQILVNLISNAKWALSQATASERVLTLAVSLNGDKRLRVAVADNGVGISPENLAHLFQHGFTTRKDGHGFGLHSSILAAREMGGNLHAQSDGPGHGAVFTLELPTQAASEA